MREILFRGKDESDKWAYGRLAYDVMSLGTSDAIVDKDGITIVNPDTVGQYTGRLDHFKTKIFEGDILMIDEDEGDVGVVSWAEDGAGYVVERDDVITRLGDFYSFCICIVGNRWDTPELLQESSRCKRRCLDMSKCPYCGHDDVSLDVAIKVGVSIRDGEVELLEENMGDVMDCLEEALSEGAIIHGECWECKKKFVINAKELMVDYARFKGCC